MKEALHRSSDSFAVKVAVLTAAMATLLGLVILGFLAVTDASVSEELIDRIDRIVQTAFTGLLALLAATRTGPADVQVTNTSTNPVQVEETAPVAETPKPPKR